AACFLAALNFGGKFSSHSRYRCGASRLSLMLLPITSSCIRLINFKSVSSHPVTTDHPKRWRLHTACRSKSRIGPEAPPALLLSRCRPLWPWPRADKCVRLCPRLCGRSFCQCFSATFALLNPSRTSLLPFPPVPAKLRALTPTSTIPDPCL